MGRAQISTTHRHNIERCLARILLLNSLTILEFTVVLPPIWPKGASATDTVQHAPQASNMTSTFNLINIINLHPPRYL